jgi:hypothetical protein
MLHQTVTHYFPWDDSDTFATCGYAMTAADTHSPQPTCPACADRLAAEEAAIEETPLPLDADEARTELEPVDALLLAAHHAGECDRDCSYCDERDVLQAELARCYRARRPDLDRLEVIEARIIALGHADTIADAWRDAWLATEAARDGAADASYDEAVCR